MRDRLIEKIKDSLNRHIGKSCLLAENIVDDLLEDGAIILPVNAGDTIYRPFARGVESWVVTTIVLYPEEIVFIDDSENSFKESDIGVSIFRTREEAKQALSKLQASCEQVKEGGQE